MNLRHQVAPDCPITLRSGEERDRDFLAGIFSEVWATIPDEDKAAILSRGFDIGIIVDVYPHEAMQGFDGLSSNGGDIALNRTLVDFYPRVAVVHVAAHELAHKADDAARRAKCKSPKDHIALIYEPRRNAERRVATILKRWGYPARGKPKNYAETLDRREQWEAGYTQADEDRITANLKIRKEAQP